MLGHELKIKEFCQNVIQPKIDVGGLDSKKLAKIVLFYAGPSEEVIDALCVKNPATSPGDYILNWVTAEAEADRLDAKRIDDTSIFGYLMSAEFKNDFIVATGIPAVEFGDEKKKVWDYVSDKFSRTDFEEAATLVCGAGEDSSFVMKEMYGQLDGDRLKILNKRTADLFREFKSLGKDEVQRLMSMTYLLELRAFAKTHKDAKTLALYKRQRSYFLEWRVNKKTEFKAKPKDVRLAFRQARGEILSRYNGGAGAGPTAPNGASMPSLPKPANTP